jgi:hypothetical protein
MLFEILMGRARFELAVNGSKEVYLKKKSFKINCLQAYLNSVRLSVQLKMDKEKLKSSST